MRVNIQLKLLQHHGYYQNSKQKKIFNVVKKRSTSSKAENEHTRAYKRKPFYVPKDTGTYFYFLCNYVLLNVLDSLRAKSVLSTDC